MYQSNYIVISSIVALDLVNKGSKLTRNDEFEATCSALMSMQASVLESEHAVLSF